MLLTLFISSVCKVYLKVELVHLCIMFSWHVFDCGIVKAIFVGKYQ